VSWTFIGLLATIVMLATSHSSLGQLPDHPAAASCDLQWLGWDFVDDEHYAFAYNSAGGTSKSPHFPDVPSHCVAYVLRNRPGGKMVRVQWRSEAGTILYEQKLERCDKQPCREGKVKLVREFGFQRRNSKFTWGVTGEEEPRCRDRATENCRPRPAYQAVATAKEDSTRPWLVSVVDGLLVKPNGDFLENLRVIAESNVYRDRAGVAIKQYVRLVRAPTAAGAPLSQAALLTTSAAAVQPSGLTVSWGPGLADPSQPAAVRFGAEDAAYLTDTGSDAKVAHDAELAVYLDGELQFRVTAAAHRIVR
jgi:hypothetical protein